MRNGVVISRPVPDTSQESSEWPERSCKYQRQGCGESKVDGRLHAIEIRPQTKALTMHRVERERKKPLMRCVHSQCISGIQLNYTLRIRSLPSAWIARGIMYQRSPSNLDPYSQYTLPSTILLYHPNRILARNPSQVSCRHTHRAICRHGRLLQIWWSERTAAVNNRTNPQRSEPAWGLL